MCQRARLGRFVALGGCLAVFWACFERLGTIGEDIKRRKGKNWGKAWRFFLGLGWAFLVGACRCCISRGVEMREKENI